MTRNRSLFFILATLGAASSACSAYVDSGREQCKQNEDCDALGYVGYECKESMCQAAAPPVDPTWACLDAVGSSEPVTGSVRVSINFINLLSAEAVPGVTFALCGKPDGSCTSPMAQYQSDASGKLEVDLLAGFDGYFQAQGADIYPTLIYPPSTRRQRAPATIPLVPASFFPTMVKASGSTIAPDRSMVITTALDCLGRKAAGLALSSPDADGQTVSYVLAGGMPSRSSTVTDESGGGGFVNMPAGPAVIKSTLAGRPVGAAGVYVRPGFVSMVLIMPSGN